MVLWALVRDKAEENEAQGPGKSIFLMTNVSVFLAEIGDKPQIATTILAAKLASTYTPVTGTILGSLAAEVPVVFLVAALATRLPLKPIRWTAAALFIVLGITTLLWRQ